VTLRSHAERELAALEHAGLLRRPHTVEGAQGPEVVVNGRPLLSFCSNDYLGLAADGRLGDAAIDAIRRVGVGAAASRLVCGQMAAHRQAEDRLRAFMGAEACLLFATGYAANTGALPALTDRRDALFSDALNHASLIDGCRLSRAAVHVYRHRDLGHLRSLLAAHRPNARRALIVTDALFSMDGDRAPLEPLRRLADEHDAALMIDEAHSLGVFGPGGRGLCAEAGVVPDLLVGTLGKAFGVAGAFVTAERPIIQLLENRARSYVFSTAPSPASAAAVARAVDLVEHADDRRDRLLQHARRLRQALRDQGWNVPDGDAPIVPVLVGAAAATMELSSALFDRGILVQGIRPPTVPAGSSRLRIVPTGTHTDAHINQLLEAMASLRDHLAEGA
jgi:8-amino-7-oxononanoate synthase